MDQSTFESVWDALEDTPEAAENMKARSLLLLALQKRIRGWDEAQAAAAQRLGITQPRLNDLLRGKIDRFSLDTLLNLAGRAGLKVHIEVREAA